MKPSARMIALCNELNPLAFSESHVGVEMEIKKAGIKNKPKNENVPGHPVPACLRHCTKSVDHRPARYVDNSSSHCAGVIGRGKDSYIC